MSESLPTRGQLFRCVPLFCMCACSGVDSDPKRNPLCDDIAAARAAYDVDRTAARNPETFDDYVVGHPDLVTSTEPCLEAIIETSFPYAEAEEERCDAYDPASQSYLDCIEHTPGIDAWSGARDLLSSIRGQVPYLETSTGAGRYQSKVMLEALGEDWNELVDSLLPPDATPSCCYGPGT